MIVRQAAAVAGMAFILGAAPAHAGPCTERIYQTDLDVAKLLDSAAAQGRPAAAIGLRHHASPANSGIDRQRRTTSRRSHQRGGAGDHRSDG